MKREEIIRNIIYSAILILTVSFFCAFAAMAIAYDFEWLGPVDDRGVIALGVVIFIIVAATLTRIAMNIAGVRVNLRPLFIVLVLPLLLIDKLRRRLDLFLRIKVYERRKAHSRRRLHAAEYDIPLGS